MPFRAWMFLYSSSASLGAAPTSDIGLGGVDCPRASAIPSKANSEARQTEIHAKLLLLRRVAPLFDRASRLMHLMRALKEPVGEFQIIRVVFVGHAKSRQSPGVLQLGVQRKGIVFNRQGSAVGGNLHRPRK